MNTFVTAVAHPNIAFVKYWGNRNHQLRLPSNGSISMNLAALETRTSIQTDPQLETDVFFLNGSEQSGSALMRVQQFMDILRKLKGKNLFARISSQNNFPASAGLASSAAAFAALAKAGVLAFDLDLSERQLSRLARLGSGSAARSIPDGFVEWAASPHDDESIAFSIAAADHWQLWDCIALVEFSPKKTGSTEGHRLAESSPLQPARVADAPHRLEICRTAIIERDFEMLADLIELDSNMLHAVMMTSRPALMYWEAVSVTVMKEVSEWRRQGIPAAYTMDAGPNVHVICPAEHAESIQKRLSEIEGVEKVLASPVGEGARVI